jgi:hypothetical protein
MATYAQLPLERILDDRLEFQWVQDSLQDADLVYIIELYRTEEGLSEPERNLLTDLHNGHVLADQTRVNQTNIWIAESNGLSWPQ